MGKTLLYRLFGRGKIPAPVLTDLQREGILLIDEGVGGSATYRHFRSPGRWSNWRRTWYTTSLVLTKSRLYALAYGHSIIDISLTDERIKAMQFTVESGPRLCVQFDVTLFQPSWSGTIEYRFRTPQAQHYLELVQQHGAVP